MARHPRLRLIALGVACVLAIGGPVGAQKPATSSTPARAQKPESRAPDQKKDDDKDRERGVVHSLNGASGDVKLTGAGGLDVTREGDTIMNGGELAALFCFVFLYVAAAGSGKWSIDSIRK